MHLDRHLKRPLDLTLQRVVDEVVLAPATVRPLEHGELALESSDPTLNGLAIDQSFRPRGGGAIHGRALLAGGSCRDSARSPWPRARCATEGPARRAASQIAAPGGQAEGGVVEDHDLYLPTAQRLGRAAHQVELTAQASLAVDLGIQPYRQVHVRERPASPLAWEPNR